MRPQAIVHAKQPALRTKLALPSVGRFSSIASAEMSLAPSNWVSRKLWVGMAPTSLITFISTWVPKVGKPWPVTAFSANTCLPALTACMKAAGLSILPTPLVPRTAIALRFLAPITVPTPERPAARCMSLTTAENRQPPSPAWPMVATRSWGSWCTLCRVASASQAVLPQIDAADLSSALSFSMCK